MTQTVVHASIFAIGYILLTRLMLINWFRRLFHTKPTALISHGKIVQNGLKHARMTLPELMGKIRTKGYTTIQDVEFAIIEDTGDVSVLGKSKKALLFTVIVDGEWLDHNLKLLGVTREHVIQNLEQNNYPTDPESLVLAQLLPDGSIWASIRNTKSRKIEEALASQVSKNEAFDDESQ